MNHQIKKRDGAVEKFDKRKIKSAIRRAFVSKNRKIKTADLDILVNAVQDEILSVFPGDSAVDVEQIQDIIENVLMKSGEFAVAKSFILYRNKRSEFRQIIDKFTDTIKDPNIISLLKDVQASFVSPEYTLELLFSKYKSFYKESSNVIDLLIKGSTELVSAEAPDWEFIASRFYLYKLHNSINSYWSSIDGVECLWDKITHMTKEGLYGDYIIKNWTKEEVDELEKAIESSRDFLFTYSAIDLLTKRYLIRTHDHKVIETPQEMFIGIALHLSIPEENNKVLWAKNIYTILSKLQVTVATPTLSNSRKPLPQLSSCFEDVMPDSLKFI